jgi:hypothetical protein
MRIYPYKGGEWLFYSRDAILSPLLKNNILPGCQKLLVFLLTPGIYSMYYKT